MADFSDRINQIKQTLEDLTKSLGEVDTKVGEVKQGFEGLGEKSQNIQTLNTSVTELRSVLDKLDPKFMDDLKVKVGEFNQLLGSINPDRLDAVAESFKKQIEYIDKLVVSYRAVGISLKNLDLSDLRDNMPDVSAFTDHLLESRRNVEGLMRALREIESMDLSDISSKLDMSKPYSQISNLSEHLGAAYDSAINLQGALAGIQANDYSKLKRDLRDIVKLMAAADLTGKKTSPELTPGMPSTSTEHDISRKEQVQRQYYEAVKQQEREYAALQRRNIEEQLRDLAKLGEIRGRINSETGEIKYYPVSDQAKQAVIQAKQAGYGEEFKLGSGPDFSRRIGNVRYEDPMFSIRHFLNEVVLKKTDKNPNSDGYYTEVDTSSLPRPKESNIESNQRVAAYQSVGNGLTGANPQNIADNIEVISRAIDSSTHGIAFIGTTGSHANGASMIGGRPDRTDHSLVAYRDASTQQIRMLELLTSLDKKYATPNNDSGNPAMGGVSLGSRPVEQVAATPDQLRAVGLVSNDPRASAAIQDFIARLSHITTPGNTTYSFVQDEDLARQLGVDVGETCASAMEKAVTTSDLGRLFAESIGRFIPQFGQVGKVTGFNTTTPSDILDYVENYNRSQVGENQLEYNNGVDEAASRTIAAIMAFAESMGLLKDSTTTVKVTQEEIDHELQQLKTNITIFDSIIEQEFSQLKSNLVPDHTPREFDRKATSRDIELFDDMYLHDSRELSGYKQRYKFNQVGLDLMNTVKPYDISMPYIDEDFSNIKKQLQEIDEEAAKQLDELKQYIQLNPKEVIGSDKLNISYKDTTSEDFTKGYLDLQIYKQRYQARQEGRDPDRALQQQTSQTIKNQVVEVMTSDRKNGLQAPPTGLAAIFDKLSSFIISIADSIRSFINSFTTNLENRLSAYNNDTGGELVPSFSRTVVAQASKEKADGRSGITKTLDKGSEIYGDLMVALSQGGAIYNSLREAVRGAEIGGVAGGLDITEAIVKAINAAVKLHNNFNLGILPKGVGEIFTDNRTDAILDLIEIALGTFTASTEGKAVRKKPIKRVKKARKKPGTEAAAEEDQVTSTTSVEEESVEEIEASPEPSKPEKLKRINKRNSLKKAVSAYMSEKEKGLNAQTEAILRAYTDGTGLSRGISAGYAILPPEKIQQMAADYYGASRVPTNAQDIQGLAFSPEGAGSKFYGLSSSTSGKAAQTAVHELTHAVAESADQEQNGALFKSVADVLATKKNKYTKTSGLSNEDIDYLFNPREAVAHVAESMISGNQELESTLKKVYGKRIFDNIQKILQESIPDTFGEDAAKKLRDKFEYLDQALSIIAKQINISGASSEPSLSKSLESDEPSTNVIGSQIAESFIDAAISSGKLESIGQIIANEFINTVKSSKLDVPSAVEEANESSHPMYTEEELSKLKAIPEGQTIRDAVNEYLTPEQQNINTRAQQFISEFVKGTGFEDAQQSIIAPKEAMTAMIKDFYGQYMDPTGLKGLMLNPPRNQDQYISLLSSDQEYNPYNTVLHELTHDLTEKRNKETGGELFKRVAEILNKNRPGRAFLPGPGENADVDYMYSPGEALSQIGELSLFGQGESNWDVKKAFYPDKTIQQIQELLATEFPTAYGEDAIRALRSRTTRSRRDPVDKRVFDEREFSSIVGEFKSAPTLYKPFDWTHDQLPPELDDRPEGEEYNPYLKRTVNTENNDPSFSKKRKKNKKRRKSTGNVLTDTQQAITDTIIDIVDNTEAAVVNAEQQLRQLEADVKDAKQNLVTNTEAAVGAAVNVAKSTLETAKQEAAAVAEATIVKAEDVVSDVQQAVADTTKAIASNVQKAVTADVDALKAQAEQKLSQAADNIQQTAENVTQAVEGVKVTQAATQVQEKVEKIKTKAQDTAKNALQTAETLMESAAKEVAAGKAQLPPGAAERLKASLGIFKEIFSNFESMDRINRSFVENSTQGESTKAVIRQYQTKTLPKLMPMLNNIAENPNEENIVNAVNFAKDELGKFEKYYTEYVVKSVYAATNPLELIRRYVAQGLIYGERSHLEGYERLLKPVEKLFPDRTNLFKKFAEQFMPATVDASGEAIPEIRRITGSNVKTYQQSFSYDQDNKINRIKIAAETLNGVMVDLNGHMDAFGRIRLDEDGKENVLTRFKDEVMTQFPRTITDNFVYGAMDSLQQMFNQVIAIQDELGEVANMFGKVGGAATDAKAKFLSDSISTATQTGQGFEEGIQTNLRNLKVLGAIQNTDERSSLANQLSKTQLGAQTVFGISLDQSLESIPSILSSIQDGMIGVEDPTKKTTMALAELQDVLDKMVAAQRASGAQGDELITVYSRLASSAKEYGLSSEKLLALTSSASVSLAKGSDETSNIMKMFLEGTYSTANEAVFQKAGISTKVLRNGQLENRNFDDILQELYGMSKDSSRSVQYGQLMGSISGPSRANDFRKIVQGYGSNYERILEAENKAPSNLFDSVLTSKVENFGADVNKLNAAGTRLFGSFLVGTGILDSFGNTLSGISDTASQVSDFFDNNRETLQRIVPVLESIAKFKFVGLANVEGVINSQSKMNVLSFIPKTMGSVETWIRGAGAAFFDFFDRGDVAGNKFQRTMRTLTDALLEMADASERSFKSGAAAVSAAGDAVAKEAGAAASAGTAQTNIPVYDPNLDTTGTRTVEKTTTEAMRTYPVDKNNPTLSKHVKVNDVVDVATEEATKTSLRRVAEESASTAEKQEIKAAEDKANLTSMVAANAAEAENAKTLRGAAAFTNQLASADPLLPGQSALNRTSAFKTLAKVGDIGGAIAPSVGFDLLTGGFSETNLTRVGAGIAGGFVGGFVGGPFGAAVGYSIGQAFSDFVDLPSILGTSDTEREKLGKTILGNGSLKEESISKEDEQKTKETTKLALEAFRKSTGFDQIASDVANAGDEYKVDKSGKITYNPMQFTDASAQDIKDYEKFVVNGANAEGIGEQFTKYRVGSRTDIASAYDYLKNLGPGALEAYKNSGVSSIKEYVAQIQSAMSGKGSQFEELQKLGYQELKTQGLLSGDVKANNDIILTQNAQDLINSTTLTTDKNKTIDYSVPYGLNQYGQLGTDVNAYDARYKPQLDAIKSGKIAGDEANNILEQYNQGRSSLTALPQTLQQTIPLAKQLGMNIKGIEETLYRSGSEGQSDFLARIKELADAAAVVKEYEAQQSAYNTYTSSPIYSSSPELQAQAATLRTTLDAEKQRYEISKQYVETAKQSKSLLLDQASAVEKQAKTKRMVIGGTAAQFAAPSTMNVEDYSAGSLNDAIQYAIDKQNRYIAMNPEYQKQFAADQFLMESGTQVRGVTGVNQGFVNEYLQKQQNKLKVPDMVDMSKFSDSEREKILARARDLQGQAVALAPDLADKYTDERLIIQKQGNKLMSELGLSQEYLKMAIDENTKTNEDMLRGHYNLPSNYQAPTIWDYYNDGGREQGDVNYVKPGGNGTVPMDFAKNIAQEVLNSQGKESGGPNLNDISTVSTNYARPLFYPNPGTPGTVVEFPEDFSVSTQDVNTLNVKNMVNEAMKEKRSDRNISNTDDGRDMRGPYVQTNREIVNTSTLDTPWKDMMGNTQPSSPADVLKEGKGPVNLDKASQKASTSLDQTGSKVTETGNIFQQIAQKSMQSNAQVVATTIKAASNISSFAMNSEQLGKTATDLATSITTGGLSVQNALISLATKIAQFNLETLLKNGTVNLTVNGQATQPQTGSNSPTFGWGAASSTGGTGLNATAPSSQRQSGKLGMG